MILYTEEFSKFANSLADDASKTSMHYFRNKKILITGVSGIIGINLLFFFDSILKSNNISIKIDGSILLDFE